VREQDVRDATDPRRYMNAMHHLVIGAGPTGRTIASLLAAGGERVVVASRSGRGPATAGIEHRVLDATDTGALTAAATGATTIFNCAMPPYDRWAEDFPPIAAAVLAATVASGAALVTIGNVYAYGEVQPFLEGSRIAPTTVKGRVRAQMWRDALASGARVCEVRGSDYLGHAAMSLFTIMALPAVRRGEPATMVGDLDAPHSWTYTGDVARTAIAASRTAASWGRAWHVPSTTMATRAMAERLCAVGNLPAPQLVAMSRAKLAALAVDSSIFAAVVEMLYLVERPAVLDATETAQSLAVTATPFDEVLRDTLR